MKNSETLIMYIILLTNTNNQNICWDDLTTFKHNLFHLDGKRGINQDKYHRAKIQNLTTYSKLRCLVLHFYLAIDTFDLCYVIIHVESDVLLCQHLQWQYY